MANSPQVQPFISQCQRIEAVARAWRAMDANTKSCVNGLLQPNNQSIPVLIEMGLGPSDSQASALVAKCHKIQQADSAWKAMEANAKSCVGGLLHANNQSAQDLTALGVGPSDSQVSPLINQCQQVDAARRSWASLDHYVNACIERILKNGGQSIESLASQRIAPADPQVARVMSKCQTVSSRNLMKNISCEIDGVASLTYPLIFRRS